MSGGQRGTTLGGGGGWQSCAGGTGQQGQGMCQAKLPWYIHQVTFINYNRHK